MATACGGDAAGVDSSAPTSAVASIRIEPTSVTVRGIGLVRTVTAAALDARGAPLPSAVITWTSDRPNIVSVNPAADGARVTTIAPGSATIRASSGTVSSALEVTVAADLTDLRLSAAALALTVGDDSLRTVLAAITADSGVSTVVTWTSSAPTVASVSGSSSSGVVLAVSPGSATITATARTNFGATRSVTVPVTVTLPTRAVRILSQQPDLGVGRSATLEVRVSGESGFPRTLTWISRSPGVAAVTTSGMVSAMTLGRATIVAVSTADATVRDSVTLQVTASPLSFADFIAVAPGEFIMGNDSRAEFPAHRVIMTQRYALQRTEITQALWRAAMGNNPSARPCDECPVEQVSWNDIELFLSRINAAVTGVQYRLPTEAEWEYAARAGTTGELPGELTAIAWFGGNSSGSPRPAGTRAPNAWGFYDMIGNVAEWLDDALRPYSTATVTNPRGASSGTRRGVRGGSFEDTPLTLRVSGRGEGILESRVGRTGFRLVRLVPNP